MSGRLAGAVLASALLRLAESRGGFGAVLALGEDRNGTVGVVLLERGASPRFFERTLSAEARYEWVATIEGIDDMDEFSERLRRLRDRDPDLWIVELDIASSDRFAAEMNALD